MDGGTVAILAAVLWLDGWRRLDDAILVVRNGVGAWSVRAPWARAGAWALTAWWPPLVMPVVVRIPGDDGSIAAAHRWETDLLTALARGRRRLRRARFGIAVLRALGVLMIAWIALGIPLATTRLGSFGLLAGIAAAFALAVPTMLIAVWMLRMLGARTSSAWRLSLPLLVPFGAPRAAELVVDEAVRGLPPLAHVAVLLGEPRFLVWIRPWAFDALHGRPPREGDDRGVADAVRGLPRILLERAMRLATPSRTEQEGVRHCPRCGRSYHEGADSCADCHDLPLAAHG